MNPHVRRGNDRDACADGELAAAANFFRQGGREPWCEDVHPRFGLRHGCAPKDIEIGRRRVLGGMLPLEPARRVVAAGCGTAAGGVSPDVTSEASCRKLE